MPHPLSLSLSFFLAACLVAAAGAYTPFNYGPQVPGMDWFRDAKFGMFIHWGPVSQWGTEISFPLVCESFPCTVAEVNHTSHVIHNADELRTHRQAYADLMHTFNPVDFDADNMATLAKQAGFKYMVFTTVHCDGFINWKTQLTSYNIMNTPFGRDVYGELVTAFRKQGLRVGAYVCPSFWNNNSYWAPDALTALGPVCAPNYDPQTNPQRWSTFTNYLLSLMGELADNYAPDLYWLDCANSPPRTDTRTEQVLQLIRQKNPEAVVMTRNGVYTDYFETDDQSEHLALSILGQQQMSAGYQFEIPSVLQSSHQWAYDPFSGQKNPAEILANLILLNSKNGNYLLNVAPSPLGVWAPGAIGVLQKLADWFSVNGEAFEGTSPLYPFQYGNVFVLSKANTVYLLVPSTAPGLSSSTSTPSSSSSTKTAKSRAGDGNFSVPWIRPSLLADSISGIEVLGEGSVTYSIDSAGLIIHHSGSADIVPLHSYYSAANKDTAPCGMRDCNIYTSDNYVLVGTEGSCYTSQQPGTVHLDLIFNEQVTDNALTNTTWSPAGYGDIDVECYGYLTQQPNTIPLDAYYDGHDYWMLASDQSRAQATARGYTNRGTVAYILPAQSAPSSLATVFKISFASGAGEK